jgi:glycosyltransferase involved in cell wall biosynthesis
MKIIYLCTDPGIPVFGRKGCSTHVRETCYALQRLGHEVKLFCSNIEGDHDLQDKLDIINVQSPKSKKIGFDLRHILLDRRMWARLDRFIRDWKPDAIYERYSLYSKAGEKSQLKYGLPRLMEVNAFLTMEQKDRIRFGWLARRIERRLIRNSPHVIVVSEPLRQDVYKLGIPLDAIEKMPMAVNLDGFNPSRNGSRVREKYHMENRFVIGYVGTLSGWHGLRLIHDVAIKLKSANVGPISFLIVGGEGEKLEKHRRKVRKKGLEDTIQYIGSVSHDDVPNHIRAMDIAMIPDTTYWSSPAKLFEYQASGIPVLAPSYPAIHEALEHGREGMIFEPGNTDQIAALIQEMQSSPGKLRDMGEAARVRAEKEHSWEKNGQAIIDLYLQMGRKTLV